MIGTLLRGELEEFSQQGVPRAVLRMRGHAGHRRVSAARPLFPGVLERPPPGLGTHQEADIVKAVEKQPALILLQPHGLQPLPDALFQRPRT